MSDKLTRIAIVDKDVCKPNKCNLECKRSCPVNQMGKECINVTAKDIIAQIIESACIGCGICVKKCPFRAIKITNLPTNLSTEIIHRYSENSFKLHRLPIFRPGVVMGVVGKNGIGKSTVMKILANRLKPNLGKIKTPPSWQEILTYHRGSELQHFFKRLVEDRIKVVIKPQFLEVIRKTKGCVGDLLKKYNERDMLDSIAKDLRLDGIWSSALENLSGGELQRFAIAIACLKKADVYMFDEPSSYLDISQRVAVARMIRSLVTPSTFVLVIEHDMSILDYLSDSVCILYGQPGVYGVVTRPFNSRDGINNFLHGFVPTENIRFRDEALSFTITEAGMDSFSKGDTIRWSYPAMTISLRDNNSTFRLNVEPGEFGGSEIIVMLGENGTGKTTFIKALAGIVVPDTGSFNHKGFKISHKPQQYVLPRCGTVQDLLLEKLRGGYNTKQFQADVAKPLMLESLLDMDVSHLSGGETQRVALAICLGMEADIYLIDEPSAHLDSEQRLAVAKMIKRHVFHVKKTAFVVEHDIMMATYLADKVVVYEGTPAAESTALSPLPVADGMNLFLKSLQVTFRKDPTSHRPRINKPDSIKDREQKLSGNFFSK